MKEEYLGFDVEDDLAIINITILDKSQFLSPVCGNNVVISHEVSDYLDNAIKVIPSSYNIKVLINTDDELHFDIYERAIKNYYSNNLKQDLRDLAKNKLISALILLIGIIVISVLIFLKLKNLGELFSTILEIIGWVFIWQATDMFFFERNKIKRNIRKSTMFINSRVEKRK